MNQFKTIFKSSKEFFYFQNNVQNLIRIFTQVRGLALIILFTSIGLSTQAQWMLINEDGGTPDSKAALEVRDTTRGIMLPRVTKTQMDAIGNAIGLVVYNTDSSAIYYNNGSGWASISSSGTTQFAVPAGSIIPFGGDTANMPAGFLLCDGSALPQASYSELYTAIGKSWGGDATIFNLPDLRGRFLRGTNLGSGNDPDATGRTAINTGGNTGDNVGALQSDNTKSHIHSVDPPSTNTSTSGSHTHSASLEGATVGSINTFGRGSGGGVNTGTTSSSGSHNHSLDIAAFNSSSTGGNETRPINANVNYIICYSSSIAAAGTNSTVFQGNVALSQLPASAFEDSTRITNVGGTTKIEIDGSNNTIFANGGSESARFNSSGFLGLNNNNPQVLLDVAGTAIIDSLRIYNAYSFPGDDGTIGQVLQTDGNGKATWETPTASPWELDNDTVSVSNKRVGIGTTTPETQFHFQNGNDDEFLISNSKTVAKSTGLTLRGARNNNVTNNPTSIFFDNYDNDIISTNRLASISTIVTNATNNTGDLLFYNYSDGSTKSETMRLTKSGDVGIGTTSPQVPLHVTGGNDASLNATNGYMVIGNTSSTNLVFDNNEILARDNGATSFLALNANGGAISMHAGINDVNLWGVFLDDGNFLLGDTITANRAKLRVAGKVFADTLAVLNGVQFPLDKGTNNQVLTADGSGGSSWETPTASPWTVSGSDVYRSSGNVGIGTSSPTAQLTIAGDSMTALTLKSLDNTNNHGIAFQNSANAYTWTIHRADAGSNDADLVFAGGDANTSVTALDERMRITKTGNIGIGTATPTASLQVNAIPPANASTGQFQIDESTTGNSMMLGRTQTYGYVQTQNSEPLALNPISNNVGIGTTAPVSVLHVDGATTIDQTATSTTGFKIRRNDDLSNILSVFTGTGKNGNLTVHDGLGTVAARLSGGTDNSFLNGTGNFGVGTASPTTKLHVDGTTTIDQPASSGTGLNIRRNSDNSQVADIYTGGSNNANLSLYNSSGDEKIRLGAGSKTTYFNSGSNMGIGTDSPTSDLHINTSTSSTTVQITNTASGSTGTDGFQLSMDATNALIQNRESGDIEFNTNSADRMIIKSDGDVGIGISAPSARLHIKGTTSDIAKFENDVGHAYQTIESKTGSKSYTFYSESGNTWGSIGSDGSDNTFRIYYGGTTGNPIFAAKSATLVGVGTTNPEAQFHVSGGNILLDNTYQLNGENSSGTAYNLIKVNASNNVVIGNDNFTDIRFHSGSKTNAMTIETGGEVGIGTTSPGDILDVNGGIDADSINVTEVNSPSTGGVNLLPIAFGRINNTPNITSGTGNFTVTKPSTGKYVITITGVSLNNSNATVMIVPESNGNGRTVTYETSGGKLEVYTWQASTNAPTDIAFSFVVYVN